MATIDINAPRKHKWNKSIYSRWQNMISRCYDKRDKRFRFYGAKGVVVCDEWRNDYRAFYNWCLDNGCERWLCLDKDIKGNGKLYSPSTCCFVDISTNASNKNTEKFLYNGEMLYMTQISKIASVKYQTLRYHIKVCGESAEEAVNKLKNKSK